MPHSDDSGGGFATVGNGESTLPRARHIQEETLFRSGCRPAPLTVVFDLPVDDRAINQSSLDPPDLVRPRTRPNVLEVCRAYPNGRACLSALAPLRCRSSVVRGKSGAQWQQRRAVGIVTLPLRIDHQMLSNHAIFGGLLWMSCRCVYQWGIPAPRCDMDP